MWFLLITVVMSDYVIIAGTPQSCVGNTTAPRLTQSVGSVGCQTAVQNRIGVLTQRTRTWWNLWVIFSRISQVVCQSQILTVRMSLSLKTKCGWKGQKILFSWRMAAWIWLVKVSERRFPWIANFAVNTLNMWGSQNLQVMLALHS